MALINVNLKKFIDKKLKQPTVVLCIRILLENVIANGRDAGLTKPEIAHIFNIECKKFGITRFRTDYVLRQTGIKGNAIFESDGRFFIHEHFLDGMSNADFKDVVRLINQQYEGVGEIRKKLYRQISDARKLSVPERKDFIMYMLLDLETEKKGQSFEVTAFAILKVFYSIRGFELNRFSTIYSNDGGIDYTSQTAVYQVTTLLTDGKFNEDLLKAPLKKRIFVFKRSVDGFDLKNMEHELVSDYIGADDLEAHLDYLLSKRPERNSDLVLDVILSEFEREHYL